MAQIFVFGRVMNDLVPKESHRNYGSGTRTLAGLAASGRFHSLGTVGSFDPASPLYAAG